MGPLVTATHLAKVRDYIDIGLSEGATLILDGRATRAAVPAEGFFLGPSIFDRVAAHMRIYREEIFGPVLCIVRVADFASAVRLINAHEYANGTALFTRSGELARDFAQNIEVGMVGINVPIPVPAAFHSFGGWRNSMFGDHGAYGMEGVRFYTRLKTVTQRWPKAQATQADFVIPTSR
jgi:malonate-semialdehyde dehydrogenase (acetylating)/methylmalonate-semialdehyde dehydrogenase